MVDLKRNILMQEILIFTADFNEELSAFKGLRDQVEYVTQAISFIVDLYPQNPNRNIILIGHSMGGLVARIALQDNNMKVMLILFLHWQHHILIHFLGYRKHQIS